MKQEIEFRMFIVACLEADNLAGICSYKEYIEIGEQLVKDGMI